MLARLSVGLLFTMLSLFASFRPGTARQETGTFRADTIRKDPDTGLAIDPHLPLVRAHCTPCHSSKLILQSHLSRPEWIEKIRWMQRTQKLWDLREAEPAVLDYLTKYYGPVTQPFDGRRLSLAPGTWRRQGN